MNNFFLYFLIIFAAISIVYFVTSYKKLDKELSSKALYTRIVVVVVILVILVILMLEIIIIRISLNDENGHILYSFFNGLLMGVYLNILIGGSGMSSKFIKIFLFSIAFIYSILGLGNLGFSIQANLPFLIYKTYTTNTIDGIYFIVANFHIVTMSLAISFLTESNR